LTATFTMMRYCFVFFLFAVSIGLHAQSEHRFTSGLAVSNTHRYGREALVTDNLAYQLYSGQFKTPAENAKLFTNDEGADIVWKSIQADTAGRFRGDVLNNGYVYLTYQSDRAQNAILNVSGNVMVYVNGEPRGGDIYNDGWMNLPVKLRAGLNEVLIRCGGFSRWQGVRARLIFTDKPAMLGIEDATLPHIIIGKSAEELIGGIVIINNSDKPLKGLVVSAAYTGTAKTTDIPVIGRQSMRKVAFVFSSSGINTKGDYVFTLTLKQNGKILDEKKVTVAAVDPLQHQSYTFISRIDGSVQYYSVAPPSKELSKPAFFLSVHGAGVQAIGQARAYQPKDWGVLVAPTNRRPRGFNWEDWGRMDALEVFELAKKQFNPDPEKIYLTGHSMGGHGTWYLGATYPGKWAAIAPCAGYPTLVGYGSADGKIPDQARSEEEKLLLRASNASNVIELAQNYKDLGVYIHHGDDDRVVSVNYARQMRKVLSDFHGDFAYYEYPGGGHWFGDQSVDWPPLFDFFKTHKIEHDTTFDKIDFVTANPAISSQYRWASIVQQHSPLDYSKFHLTRNRKSMSISGSTENVSTLKLNLDFAKPGDSISISIDSVKIATIVNNEELWLSKAPDWKIVSKIDSKQKNQVRSGTFKEAFNHRIVYVYGTHGTKEENLWAYNKARYDAEVWYYRGNGAIDIIADDEFKPEKYKDRGVVIYGNALSNAAWNKLLRNCPIKVTADRITLGQRVVEGKDLAAYFVWPREDSEIAMVAVVAGTGLEGMKATEPNQYFAAGSGFPDYLVFSSDMFRSGVKGIKATGFYDNNWRLQKDGAAAVKDSGLPTEEK
jgi:dienelactone hydrolase